MKISRFALTIVLLVIAWFHVHWSVALSLSFSALANELAAATQHD